jgi:hypothetical protein
MAGLSRKNPSKLVAAITNKTSRESVYGQIPVPLDDTVSEKNPLDAIFAAGDAMTIQGVDFKKWAATSRDVWGCLKSSLSGFIDTDLRRDDV